MAERKNLPVSEEPDFSVEMEGILPDAPVHYSQMNNMMTRLLDNELFLKKLAGKLEENKVSSAEKGKTGGIATLGEDGKLAQHVDYNNVDSVPAPAWDAVTGKPLQYLPSPHTHSKSDVGLGSVDNTADANKSVNYAASAGNADTVDGYHAAAFAPASNTHNYAASHHNHDAAYAAKSHTHDYAATNHSHAYTSLTGRPTGLDSGYVRSGQKSGTTIGFDATAEGYNTTASGSQSHAEGGQTTASGTWSHAEGDSTTASNGRTHAEGHETRASADTAHAEGCNTIASGYHSHAGGYYTIASSWGQTAIGNCNVQYGSVADQINSIFIVGNGTESARSNAFRVHSDGTPYGKRAYNTSGADYAEYFEWLDGNPEGEDRRGLFVTLDGDKIRIANRDDGYILGIISGKPSIIGNSDPDDWHGHFLCDDFGDFIMCKTKEMRTVYHTEDVEL